MEKVVTCMHFVLLVGIGGLSTACDEATKSDAGSVLSRSSEAVTEVACASLAAGGTMNSTTPGGGGWAGQSMVFVNGANVNGSVYTGASNATIEEALPTTNQGSTVDCTADGLTQERGCLLRWDLSGALPPSTTVRGACLLLAVSDASRATYEAFQLLRSWSEGSVTWTRSQAANSDWATPGAKGAADRGSVAVASIKPTTVGRYAIQLDTSTVQSWVTHPTTNAGIIFARDDAADGVSFESSSALPVRRPTLEVWY
jgi:hypothetical protein